MLEPSHNLELPEIPPKKYFTIGEVAKLCDVKPHVLRYWEQEFQQLKPVTRRGNRRYYQHHDIVLICKIRTLLYKDGFTISGASQKLAQDMKGADDADYSNYTKAELVKLRKDLEQIIKILES